jgi:hypothetical protein
MDLRQNEKKIMKLLEQLDWMFSIQNFERSIIFEKEEEYFNDDPVFCRVAYDEAYQRVIIYFYPHFFRTGLKKQREILLHEFVHTITIPLYRMARNLHNGQLYTPEQIRQEHEQATSKIEKLLDKLLCGGMRYAKVAYKEYLRKEKNDD